MLFNKNILIRCDASESIGLGHITRCLVLANNFIGEGSRIYFAMKEELGIQKVTEDGFNVIRLPKELNAKKYDRWIQNIVSIKNINIFIGDIRDGFPIKTIKELKQKGILTIAIDEPSKYAKECDLCFYPPHANIDISKYKGKVYQGLKYVILKKEFYKNTKKIRNKTPNILIMMGGTDPYNLTLKIIIKLLKLKEDIDISVVMKKKHKDYKVVSNISTKVEIYTDIDNMAEFLKGIDFGIISFGISAYELLAMGIPAIHVCLDDDHYRASGFFEKNGFAKRYKKDKIKFKKNNFNLEIKSKWTAKQNKIIKTIIKKV